MKEPEELECHSQMGNIADDSLKMQFTECDESELLRINAEVEEILYQKALEKSPPKCPPVSQNDCSSLISAAHSTCTMLKFDIDAAFEQMRTKPFIRLIRCDSDSYSPPSKQIKLCLNSAVSSVASQIDSNEGVSPLMNRLKNLYDNTSSSPSKEHPESEDEFDESVSPVAKKQTSRKSTYRPSSETDKRKLETLERVKSRTEQKLKHCHLSPAKIKKSLKHKMQDEYRSHKHSSLASRFSAEEDRVGDGDLFDHNPRRHSDLAAKATKISSAISPPRRTLSFPGTSSSPAEIDIEEQKPDFVRALQNGGADMPLLDKVEDNCVKKEIIVKTESTNITLPVTISTSACPSTLIDESKIEEKSTKNVPTKMVHLPNLGRSISVSLVPASNSKTEAADTLEIKNEPINSTDTTSSKKPAEAEKSIKGSIKVRSPHDLGIENPMKSFAVGMSKLCIIPSDLISPSALQKIIADTRTSTTARSSIEVSVITSNSSSTSSSDIPRDPRLVNKSSPIPPSVDQSPLARTSLASSATSPLVSNSPVAKPSKENATDQSPVSQTSSASPSSNGSPASKPAAGPSEELIQVLKNKIEEELRKVSSKLSQILKEYLKKNLSKKKKQIYEEENFDAFRASVSKLFFGISKLAGESKERFQKNVRYYLLKLLQYTIPGRPFEPKEEVPVILTLLDGGSLNRFWDMSVIYGVLAEREQWLKFKEKKSNLENQKPNSHSTLLSLNQPESIVPEQQNENQLHYQNENIPLNQQNDKSSQLPVNSQKSALQSTNSGYLENNTQHPIVQHQPLPTVQRKSQNRTSSMSDPIQSLPPPNQPACRTNVSLPSSSHRRLSPPSVTAGSFNQNSYAAQRTTADTCQLSCYQCPQQQVIESVAMPPVSNHQINPVQIPSTYQQVAALSPGVLDGTMSNSPSTAMPLVYSSGPTAGMPIPSPNSNAVQLTITNTMVQSIGCNNNYNQAYAAARQIQQVQQPFQHYQLQQQQQQLQQQQLQQQKQLQQQQHMQQQQHIQQQQQEQQEILRLQQAQIVHQAHQIDLLKQRQFLQQQSLQQQPLYQQQMYAQHYNQQPYQQLQLQQSQIIQTQLLPQPQYQHTNLVMQQTPQVHSQQNQRLPADTQVIPPVTAPVSVPLINSSQSPSPSRGPTPTNNKQPVSVNVVQSTSRTPPETCLVEPDLRTCKEVEKADYDLFKECTQLLKEFYKVTMPQF